LKSHYQGPKGAIEELKDNVYIVDEARQAVKYDKTTEAILSYIQTHYTEGQDVVDGLTNMEDPDFDDWAPDEIEPIKKATKDDPVVLYDPLEKEKYMAEFKEWMERKKKYRTNMNNAFGLLWGQCTSAVRNKIESRKDWPELKASHKAIDLLKAIKEITQDYQDNKYPLLSIHRAIQSVLTIKQYEGEDLVLYNKRFRNAVEHMEAQQGKLPLTEYVEKQTGYKKSKHDELTEEAYDSFIALCYLVGSQAASLKNDLANAYARGHDDYPKTLNAAISMVSSYTGSAERKATKKYDPKNEEPKAAIGFAQKGKPTTNDVTCYNCGKKGHYANKCPEKNNADERTTTPAEAEERSESPSDQTPNTSNVFMNVNQDTGLHFHSAEDGPYCRELKNKVLLDTEATHSVFSNEKFVKNIRQANSKLKIRDNGGGIMECTKQADVDGYPHPVWFNEKATTNILSFSQVETTPEWFKIEYETGTFRLVNKKTKRTTKFKREGGLYVYTPESKKPETKAKQAKIAGVGGKPGSPKNEDEWKVVQNKRSKHPRSGWQKNSRNTRATRVLSNQ
jgi:hypothetical protein